MKNLLFFICSILLSGTLWADLDGLRQSEHDRMKFFQEMLSEKYTELYKIDNGRYKGSIESDIAGGLNQNFMFSRRILLLDSDSSNYFDQDADVFSVFITSKPLVMYDGTRKVWYYNRAYSSYRINCFENKYIPSRAVIFNGSAKVEDTGNPGKIDLRMYLPIINNTDIQEMATKVCHN
jgi:hypothetical protein